jgi:hypothetical protein
VGGRQLHQTNTLAAELLDQHLATLSSAATPQVISTDRHTVKPAALLLFTIHDHEVSVFLTQRTTGSTLTALSNTRAGFTLHTATTPDLRIVAVSDVNPADLDNLLAALVQAHESLKISK